MLPAEIPPEEARQFELLIRRSGADPAAFAVRKFHARGAGFRVRVVGRGAATVYDAPDAHGWMGPFAQDLQKGLFGNPLTVAVPDRLAGALDEVQRALAQRGLPGALEALNRRVPHRFTAVYRLAGQSLRNVATADKHPHLEPLELEVVPLMDSFCQFVLRDGLFLTRDSGHDVRLSGHPYSGIVGCYVGVPIADRQGRPAGTLCHFDLQCLDVPDDEYLLLDHAARLMTAFLDG